MESRNRKLNIKIITTEPFPIGLAATNRIFTYAKGLVEHNCTITVYCIKPTERPNKVFNHNTSGTVQGIYYEYPGKEIILDPKFIVRRIDNFMGMLKTSLILLKEKKQDKTDAFIFYSASTSRALIFFLIARLKNILFLKEESEFPAIYMRRMNYLQRLLFRNLHYSLFDGSLIMTKRLIEYFVKEKKRKTPYLHVPMTVDFERFIHVEKHTATSPYIAYCGMLNNEKDGVGLLIDAFSLIAHEFPDLQLYLIGDAATKSENTQYLNQIKIHNLSDRVVFTGRVSKDAIPKLLVNAKLLVLPRPLSFQSEGGFPTKLGEYLATGNPVVVTRVGEIPDYLNDKVNAFIAEPGSIKSLANKLRDVLTDYPNALKIGANGREVVFKHFNYKIQTNNIIQFINSFKKNVS